MARRRSNPFAEPPARLAAVYVYVIVTCLLVVATRLIAVWLYHRSGALLPQAGAFVVALSIWTAVWGRSRGLSIVQSVGAGLVTVVGSAAVTLVVGPLFWPPLR